MIDILHRFLLQNRSISIPGLGTLHAERIPARLSSDRLQIIPPGYSFRFDKYFDAPDKAFFVYLSGRKGVPEYESMRLYNQFAQDFRSAIMLEERAEWPGIGYFRKNVSGEVEFVQTGPVETPYAPVDLTVAEPEAEIATAGVVAEDSLNPAPAAGGTFETDVNHQSVAAGGEISPESADQPVHVPANETADNSAESSPVAELAAENESVDYAYPLEDDSSAPVRTNRIIMRIGWGIAAAASLLMILHFSQHGFTLKAAANNQTFQPARP